MIQDFCAFKRCQWQWTKGYYSLNVAGIPVHMYSVTEIDENPKGIVCYSIVC